jgi:hypothetical protein
MRAADVPWSVSVKRQKAKRRERDRKRKRAERQSQPRAEWLLEHATERAEPWKALAMSRSTYYRLKKANKLRTVETGPSPNMLPSEASIVERQTGLTLSHALPRAA